MARKGRTLAQVEEQRGDNERERQDYFKQLQRGEQRKDQEKAQEAAEQVISEYRERTFRPNPEALHKPQEIDYTPDSRRSEPTPEELAHEEKRRAFASMGLVSRMPVPPHPKEAKQQDEAERQRRAMLGIPQKVRGYGRPPWA